MKKLLMVSAMIVVALNLNAQAVGIQAGVIAANASAKDGTEKASTKDLISWKAGVVFDWHLSDNLNFMPNVNLLVKGAKSESSSSGNTGGITFSNTQTGKEKLTYLEVPLNFVYNAGGKKGAGLFVGLGPSVSIGLSGTGSVTTTTTVNGTSQTQVEENKVKFDGKANANDNDDHLKAFELGGNFLIGYKFKNGLFVNANYNQSFTNIAVEQNQSFKNMYIGLNLGFFLTK